MFTGGPVTGILPAQLAGRAAIGLQKRVVKTPDATEPSGERDLLQRLRSIVAELDQAGAFDMRALTRLIDRDVHLDRVGGQGSKTFNIVSKLRP